MAFPVLCNAYWKRKHISEKKNGPHGWKNNKKNIKYAIIHHFVRRHPPPASASFVNFQHSVSGNNYSVSNNVLYDTATSESRLVFMF